MPRAVGVCLLSWGLAAAAAAQGLQTCRLQGVEHDALCGTLSRPLDPARPQGPHIDLHFAVLPALARQKKPDPVFFVAGGPGQSAMELAGPVRLLFSEHTAGFYQYSRIGLLITDLCTKRF